MISSTNSLTGKLAIDVKDVGELRQAARQNSPEALKGAAQQFEALFMNMVMKSMRDATPQDGMFDSQQSRMYTSMLDQQLSQTLASKGVGLADALFRQLSTKLDQAAMPGADNDMSGILPQPLPALKPIQIPALDGARPADTVKPSASQPP
ncbi:rod-binding protein, partial [Noviherbaspirillum denitrificans]|uniref:rod-binding protein n=1 Tax=Noviherbaspirillum denitrificans TaxID=1968433 RepID=UPI00197F8E3D